MRLPRDVSGADLVKRLGQLGYRVTRQIGSHIRLTCDHPRTHHITIRLSEPLQEHILEFGQFQAVDFDGPWLV